MDRDLVGLKSGRLPCPHRGLCETSFGHQHSGQQGIVERIEGVQPQRLLDVPPGPRTIADCPCGVSAIAQDPSPEGGAQVLPSQDSRKGRNRFSWASIFLYDEYRAKRLGVRVPGRDTLAGGDALLQGIHAGWRPLDEEPVGVMTDDIEDSSVRFVGEGRHELAHGLRGGEVVALEAADHCRQLRRDGHRRAPGQIAGQGVCFLRGCVQFQRDPLCQRRCQG